MSNSPFELFCILRSSTGFLCGSTKLQLWSRSPSTDAGSNRLTSSFSGPAAVVLSGAYCAGFHVEACHQCSLTHSSSARRTWPTVSGHRCGWIAPSVHRRNRSIRDRTHVQYGLHPIHHEDGSSRRLWRAGGV